MWIFVWFWLMFCFYGFYLNRSLETFKLYLFGEWLPLFCRTHICHTNHHQDRTFVFLWLYQFFFLLASCLWAFLSFLFSAAPYLYPPIPAFSVLPVLSAISTAQLNSMGVYHNGSSNTSINNILLLAGETTITFLRTKQPDLREHIQYLG